MKTLTNMVMSVVLLLGANLAFADGSLEGTMIKYALAHMDLDFGNKSYVLIDIDDSVATECAIYPLGNDVAFMELGSDVFSQGIYHSLVEAQASGQGFKVDYHTYASTALSTTVCIFDDIIVITP